MIAELSFFQKAIREESLCGWFFYNFQHRDPVTDYLLGLSPDSVNTRPWGYFIPVEGTPVKIVSAVERGVLSTLPGRENVYYNRTEFAGLIASFPVGSIGMQFSTELPVLSYLDYGTMTFFLEAGITPVSSASLVQRMAGVLDKKGIESHSRAAVKLYAVVDTLWERVKQESGAGESLYEGDVLGWLEELLADNGLERDHSPIVAAGVNTSDPHYSPPGRGARIGLGDVVQIDVWAKEPAAPDGAAAIYADISWVGVFASAPGIEEQKLFDLVTRGRDEVVRYIEGRLAAGDAPSGADVDGFARTFFADNGVGGMLKHRTGHGIDRLVHGWGVNLDSVEFPDSRKLMEGSCFSVEPGLYGGRFGMRTEIDVYIEGNKAHVSGGKPQTRLLTL